MNTLTNFLWPLPATTVSALATSTNQAKELLKEAASIQAEATSIHIETSCIFKEIRILQAETLAIHGELDAIYARFKPSRAGQLKQLAASPSQDTTERIQFPTPGDQPLSGEADAVARMLLMEAIQVRRVAVKVRQRAAQKREVAQKRRNNAGEQLLSALNLIRE